MRRIFTSSILTAALIAASFNSFGQTCATTTTITAPNLYTFDANAQNFTGDFSHNNGPDNLQSSTVGAGTTKILRTPALLVPASLPNIQFGFDLAGNANVTGYSIDVRYYSGGFQTINLCNAGGALASGGTYNFSLPTPAAVLGQRIEIQVTFIIAGSTNQVITIDNFRVNLVESQIELPVKFSSLEARALNGGVNLTWNVASEENVARYEVERSLDNRNFSTVGSTEASGQDAYSFLDTKAAAGTSYYRVKAVDVDGRLTYSAIVTMKGGKSSITLRAFPMPVISDITVQHGTATVGSEISISSAEGRAIKTVIPAKGSQQTVISLSSLKPGIYVIRYSTLEGEVETLKIVKQ